MTDIELMELHFLRLKSELSVLKHVDLDVYRSEGVMVVRGVISVLEISVERARLATGGKAK